MFEDFIEGSDKSNYYGNHIGLSVAGVVYLFSYEEHLRKFLGDYVSPHSIKYCDAVIKQGVFVKERYGGQTYANKILEKYGMTPSQYLGLSNKERDYLLKE